MAKIYNTFTNVATGDPLPATTFNNLLTNVANYRVPPVVITSGINTSQSIANTTDTYLQWTGTPGVDTDSFWSSGANTRFTCNTAGIYQVNAAFQINSNAVSVLYINITLNGGTVVATGVGNTAAPSQNGVARVAVSGIANVTAGQYFEVAVLQTSGASRNPYVGHFSAAWLGQAS